MEMEWSSEDLIDPTEVMDEWRALVGREMNS
jgi:hypothetical protein